MTKIWMQNCLKPPAGPAFRDDASTYQRLLYGKGKSERSDWSFLGRDFAIRTVSVETVISCVFFAVESRQIQNKHGPSAI